MSPRSVGSVSVSVVPDAEGFVPKARAELEPAAKDLGDTLGRAIGSHLNDSFSPYLDEIRAKLDLLGTKDVSIRVKVDDNGSLDRTAAKIAAVDASAGAAGGGVNLFSGRIAAIGGLAVAAADVAIPALLAIGAAAAGLLAGVGVLALGASGIGAALEAHDKQSSGGGGGGGASSALSLQSAQINAAAATRSAQDQLTQAIQSQAKAEQGLHDARVQALQDLQDLDNKLKDNTLNQQQAAINLRDAKATLAVTLAAPGAGLSQYADQVAQARLNVALAQQKANELALQGTRLTADDTTAHTQGVAGNPQVVAAQQALVDANHKLAEAQANIGITAQKNAIALAQAGAAAAGAAGGVDQFANAMAKLNPLQQQFVEFLLKLKPLFDELKAAASEFLPGLEQGIKNALPAFGPILAIVGDVAKAMGAVFANIGAQFNTPEGRKFLGFLAVELPKQIVFLGNLFIDFGKILSGIFEAAAPLIDAFDNALTGALASLGNSANGNALKTFFDSLIPLVQPTFQVISALSGLIGQLLKAFVPALTPVLKVVADLATNLAKIAVPVIKPLAQAFADLLTSLTPLLPLFGQMIEQILPPLARLFDAVVEQGLVPFINALIKQIGPVMPDLIKAFNDFVLSLIPLIPPLTEILVALTPLVPLFVELQIGPLKAITPLIKALTPVIVELSKILTSVLTPAVSGLTSLFNTMGDVTSQAFKAIGTAASWVWTNVIKPIFGYISSAIGPLKTIIGTLGTVWHDVWQAISTAITNVWKVIKPILDSIRSAISTVSSALSSLFTETVSGKGSVGAPLPGYGPDGKPLPHKAGGGPVLAGEGYRWNEFGQEMFIPKVDGTIINAIQTGQLVKALNNGGGSKANYFAVYGQSDPVATAHQTANRFAARGV